MQLSFLKKLKFEPPLLDYAEKIKQPNTVTEFVSIGAVLGSPAPDFKGPVQVSDQLASSFIFRVRC